jgi:glycosyltransferase involved in cell wall biosynthesis
MSLLPLVTVIMPVRNEADFIARSLGAVLAQDYPHDRMEVLIADGMSTDATRAIIAETAAQHPGISIRVLDNPGQIVPTGMNIALREAHGTIIVRVDGHCEIAPDYVSRCVEHLQADGVDGVGGPIQTVGNTELSRTIAVAMSTGFGVGGSAFRTVHDKPMLVDTIAFPAYTRSAIDAAGPYDEELVRNQDDEYNYRLRGLGFRLLLSPDIRSRYYSRSSLRSLWRQYYQYGLYKVRVMQKHPTQMRPRQLVPPLFATALLGGAVLAPVNKVLRRIWLTVVALYAIANLLASWQAASGHGRDHLRYLPLVYATLHMSYGLGFLVGLTKFAKRWNDCPLTPGRTP